MTRHLATLRVIVTLAIYPCLDKLLHFDIQSTGQKSIRQHHSPTIATVRFPLSVPALSWLLTEFRIDLMVTADPIHKKSYAGLSPTLKGLRQSEMTPASRPSPNRPNTLSQSFSQSLAAILTQLLKSTSPMIEPLHIWGCHPLTCCSKQLRQG